MSKEKLRLATDIVSAYVGNNRMSMDEIPDMIRNVSVALEKVENPDPEPPTPAVPIKKSITPDYIICLEDGAKKKMLKRYIWVHFSLTPDEYRQKWGLSHDYPMTAPNYSKRRSEVAKETGLGRV